MTNDQQVAQENSPQPTSLIVWLFITTLVGGLAWQFYKADDFVAVGAIVAVFVAGLKGYRMGLVKIAGSLLALAAAVVFAPALGASKEAFFAEHLGTSGLLNRVISIGSIGLGIMVVVSIVMACVSKALLKNRPFVAASNRWLGFGLGTAQGVVAVVLLLGGLLTIAPTLPRSGYASDASFQNHLRSGVRQIASQTKKSVFGPTIEKYNWFARVDGRSKLAQIQNRAQMMRDPAQLSQLLNQPATKRLQQRPEFQKAMRELMSDREIRDAMNSGRGLNPQTAMKLMNHPAITKLIDEPGFLKEATKALRQK